MKKLLISCKIQNQIIKKILKNRNRNIFDYIDNTYYGGIKSFFYNVQLFGPTCYLISINGKKQPKFMEKYKAFKDIDENDHIIKKVFNMQRIYLEKEKLIKKFKDYFENTPKDVLLDQAEYILMILNIEESDSSSTDEEKIHFLKLMIQEYLLGNSLTMNCDELYWSMDLKMLNEQSFLFDEDYQIKLIDVYTEEEIPEIEEKIKTMDKNLFVDNFYFNKDRQIDKDKDNDNLNNPNNIDNKNNDDNNFIEMQDMRKMNQKEKSKCKLAYNLIINNF